MNKLNLKTPEDIKIMAEGGKKLSSVKKALIAEVRAGVSAYDIELLADRLIKESGAVASFKMVPGYSWATCVNVNAGIVHGIPKKEMVFQNGDVVSVDVGLFYKGFHTDTSMSVLIGDDKEKNRFLEYGRKALKKAIGQVRVGKTINDISKAIEDTITEGGYSPVRTLVGHGVGRELHEYPAVPCIVSKRGSDNLQLVEGLVLAIEVMYAMGKPDLITESDGWTIASQDGKITALFEETVALTGRGSLILT